jgi:hypothetical protein
MPRFVVLRHEMPQSSSRAGVHWDLMLEHEDRLRTWALAAEPASESDIVAEALPDHRMEYLQYEGPISGDRGEVRRWDEGTYELRAETADELVLKLSGKRLTGTVELKRRSGSEQTWSFLLREQAV